MPSSEQYQFPTILQLSMRETDLGPGNTDPTFLAEPNHENGATSGEIIKANLRLPDPLTTIGLKTLGGRTVKILANRNDLNSLKNKPK